MLAASYHSEPLRRFCPRVPVQELCTEHDDHNERHAVIIDLSEDGMRVQRPVGGTRSRNLQLEFEIPGIDELVWAKGEIRFDQVWQLAPDPVGGLTGLVRCSGIHLVAAAERHKRLLREYVNDTWNAMQSLREWSESDEPLSDMLMNASCYLRG